MRRQRPPSKPTRARPRIAPPLQPSGKLNVQYTGEVADSFEFGSNFGQGEVLKATCPEGKGGVAGLRWRRGTFVGKEDQAWKPGGVQVFCGTE